MEGHTLDSEIYLVRNHKIDDRRDILVILDAHHGPSGFLGKFGPSFQSVAIPSIGGDEDIALNDVFEVFECLSICKSHVE